MKEYEPPSSGRPPWQFSLAKMLLVFTLVSAALAPLAYLMRALQGQRRSHLVFILLSLAAPSLLLVVASLLHYLLQRFPRSPRH